VRPFSSPSEPAGLFDGILARGEVRSRVGDAAWLAALLEVEAALARSAASVGVIPGPAGPAIAAVCATVDIPIPELSARAATTGNPVVALVARLRTAVGPDLAAYVHIGATSQDILDSAAMLIAYRALGPLLDDLRGAADAAAALARAHRGTAMAGRTLLRQATPTTFGLKAAGWTIALDRAVERLSAVRATRLAAQYGGAAGTRAGLGGAGEAVARALAAELSLVHAGLPWHTDRTRIAELAGALGTAAGVAGKVARDVTLLGQDEVAEVAEGTPGGSSAMPHKQNPVAAISALAGAAQAPGLVATLLSTMVQEHERAAGAWHAEWRPLRELLIATGSAAAWLRDCLSELVVHPAAMRANLDRLLAVLGQSSPDLGDALTMTDAALAARSARLEEQ
jgi:3-carboxy-cis,cis-muconate cycloisomerase